MCITSKKANLDIFVHCTYLMQSLFLLVPQYYYYRHFRLLKVTILYYVSCLIYRSGGSKSIFHRKMHSIQTTKIAKLN